MSEILARVLPLGLVLLMFVVGLRLTPQQFLRAFARPKALGLGLAVQWLGLPMLALALGALLDLAPEMRAGLLLVALAPGGVTSNYIAHLARADLALSTAMTLVTTLLASVTIPVALLLTGLVALPDGANLLSISAKMSVIAILPAGLGMAVRAVAPRASGGLLRWLEPAARFAFAAMVISTFLQNRDAMLAHIGSVGLAVIALNLGALALAWGVSRMAKLTMSARRAIMVEASLQNVAVVLFVGGALLRDPTLSIPALIYAVVMNVSAIVQIALSRHRAHAD
ncbi:hypothetical protein [Aliiroseovarius subalbicans]|uniref:bile acid:sodium symporter family protein n=1 Tax=Aliiroseovarius subalbicans TaxID=2925840 RepID=UPI001F58DCE6|nr:hypothetical protein [Aliiroseovarius subalbicans]MCI2399612.1 hypothetical protein [Aliiroseovarius subalbicans]